MMFILIVQSEKHTIVFLLRALDRELRKTVFLFIQGNRVDVLF